MDKRRYRMTAIVICWTIAGLAVVVLTYGPLMPVNHFSAGDQPTLTSPSQQAEQGHKPSTTKHFGEQERQLVRSLKKDSAIQRGLQRLKQRLGMKEKRETATLGR